MVPHCGFSLHFPNDSKFKHLHAHLSSLESLKDHCPSLPDGQCLENYCFIYFVQFLVVSIWRIDLIPVTSSWLEAGFSTPVHKCFSSSFSQSYNPCCHIFSYSSVSNPWHFDFLSFVFKS